MLANITRERERGATMIETVLSFIIILTLTFGIMEACLALYRYHYIAEAAREGTRYAIVRGANCSGLGSDCPASASDIQTYVKGLGFPGIDSNAMTVTPAWPASNSPGNPVSVTVLYQYNLSIPFVLSRTLTMSSTSQMVISQ